MSARNTQEAKAQRRLRRSIRKGAVPTKIDLVDYVKLRTRCSTGTAVKVLLAGSLKVDSHPVGYVQDKHGKRWLRRYIDAKHRDSILIVPPKVLEGGE